MLSRVCVDPAHGVCPASALGRWTPPEERLVAHERERDGDDDAPEISARAAGSEADGRRVAASRNVASGAKRCATLVRLLRKLRPTESRRHAELLLRVCELRPHIAALYLPHATYSLDPRPSIAWLAAAALLGEVAAAASDPAPARAPEAPGEAEGAASVKAAMPASATAPASRRASAPSGWSGTPRSACCSACCAPYGGAWRAWTSRRPPPTPGAPPTPKPCGARAAPRGAALAAPRTAGLPPRSRHARVVGRESDVNRIHARNALAETAPGRPEGLAEANVDPAKTLPRNR